MGSEETRAGMVNRRELLKQAAAMAVVSVFPSWSLAETQLDDQNSLPRIRENFDQTWKFLKSDPAGAREPEFSDDAWKILNLPHDWSIEGPFNEKEPADGNGAYLPTGIGWYRKRFLVPSSQKDRRITIEFDGVYQNSEVWINGHYLGKRPYGFVPFFYEITPHVRFGSENVIAVRVDNSHQTNCRWYSGSGIYRHTHLLSTNALHVAYWGTFVTTPQVSNEAATLQIKTRVRNDGGSLTRCTLVTDIIDDEGKTVGTEAANQSVTANGEHEFAQQIQIQRPRLWSVHDPYQYKIRSTVRENDRVVDDYETRFGIRDAVFDVDKGFLLNGEHVKLNGVCLHHDGGCVGAAVPEGVWERRLEILQEMGCNAIRTSHNPYSSEFLDLCDKMGFLVMNEAFDEWKVPKGQIGPNGYSNYFDEWYERDVTNFIHRDRNRPSVVVWSAGNEVGDQSEAEGPETLRKLLKVFHTEDPTRPVTVGCDRIMSEPLSNRARPEFLESLDIVGYNYVDRWRDRTEQYYSIDRSAFPHRRFIGTESDSMCGIRGDYRGLFPGKTPFGFPYLKRGRNLDVELLWQFVSTYDYVAGDFMWTGIDYLGEARWPMKAASSGVMDTCGFKKDGFYFYQSQWTDKPVLHLYPHWNWKSKEGQFVSVSCYTNCDTVELFLNDKPVGVKGYEFPRLGMEGTYGKYPARANVIRTTSDLHLAWDVPYEAGTLKAVGKQNGKVVATEEISTTGDPAAISVSVDRHVISADNRDVAHLTIQILDGENRVVPTADNEVTLVVEGEGTIIGMDNGNPESHEDYRSNRRKAFNGLCLAIIQSTGKSGQIRVKATSPSLADATATLTSRI